MRRAGWSRRVPSGTTRPNGCTDPSRAERWPRTMSPVASSHGARPARRSATRASGGEGPAGDGHVFGVEELVEMQRPIDRLVEDLGVG